MSITKKDLMEALERNKSFQRALKTVNKDQQDRIRAILDSFMGDALGGLGPVLERVNSDPEYVEQVREHLRRGAGSKEEVVISEEPATSGSKVD